MYAGASNPDSPLIDLRRRGQFLIGMLLWAAAGGLVVVGSGYVLIVYHYAVSLAERIRLAFGFAPPAHGPIGFCSSRLLRVPL